MTITQEPQFHVLAVDDSLLDRKIIEKLLRTSSYQVTTVDSGSKALEFLGLQDSSVKDEMRVSLIITDYCMPGMTGYDLLKRIKESADLRDIPVVIMSSENVPSRINRCLEGGAEEFFLKPVQLADMTKLRPHILKCKSKEQLWPNGTTKTSSSQSSKRKAMDERCPHERNHSICTCKQGMRKSWRMACFGKGLNITMFIHWIFNLYEQRRDKKIKIHGALKIMLHGHG